MVELQKNEGVLLINLGSPKELSKKSVRQYLRVFLSDDNVVDLPKFFQQFILRLFILPFRPKNTLEAYEKIWTKEGSPLIISTESIANKLTEKTGWNVEYAMRYEEPSIEKALHKFKKNEINKIYVISLYPHNAMATTVTTELETRNVAMNVSNDFELIFTKPFFDNEEYINAMVNSIRPYVENKSYDKIIFSYHGIPKRQAKKTDETGEHCFSTSNCCEIENDGSKDCYRSHTRIASDLTAKKLGLKDDQWEIAYQSRIGPGWLTPFTDKRLAKLPEEGKDNIAILCPSFISDCLETLEEIDIRGRETFLKAGGKNMTYIPCLNDSEDTINLLENLVRAS
jgi:ferrochelatase|tara:strand:- start:474 stop:1496 length:1023 start_codon:yes stop_codon:yes gene_type:complete